MKPVIPQAEKPTVGNKPSKSLVRSTHDGELPIGDVAVPCYVLADGRRVLSGRGMQTALDLGQSRGQKIPQLIEHKTLKPIVSKELEQGIFAPIEFVTKKGFKALGYEATVLVDLCDMLLEARKLKLLSLLPSRYEDLGDRAETLTRSFARIGIIALVDEATGYQDVRNKEALRQILDKYLLKDYAKWAKRFPDEFYQQMFKLKNWPLDLKGMKKPGVVGNYTNDIIYNRLAPGILHELKTINPKTITGRRKAKHHQFLTEDIGHAALQRHIDIVIAFMKASPNWISFMRMLERAFPKIGSQLGLELDDAD